MRASFPIAGALLAALLPFGAFAAAQPAAETPPETAGTTQRETRAEKRLVLRIEGPLSPERESALSSLLRAEIAEDVATLSIERSDVPILDWIRATRAAGSALVIAVLDVRSQHWDLTIVDASRGRAIARRLTGGEETNAAALEAVAAILASAVAAVHEGLEVASEPLESVLGETTAPAKASEPPKNSPAAAPRERPFVAFRGGLFANVTSFAGAASAGLQTSLGLRWGDTLDLRALAGFNAPVKFETALGDFDLGRIAFGSSLGWVGKLGTLEVKPELGVSFELLRRSGMAPRAGVTGSEEASYWRVGPAFGLRLSYPIAPWAAVELAGGFAYFARDVAFVAAGSPPAVLGELSKTEFSGSLGLELFAPD